MADDLILFLVNGFIVLLFVNILATVIMIGIKFIPEDYKLSAMIFTLLFPMVSSFIVCFYIRRIKMKKPNSYYLLKMSDSSFFIMMDEKTDDFSTPRSPKQHRSNSILL